jgi:hypothetical protein
VQLIEKFAAYKEKQEAAAIAQQQRLEAAEARAEESAPAMSSLSTAWNHVTSFNGK